MPQSLKAVRFPSQGNVPMLVLPCPSCRFPSRYPLCQPGTHSRSPCLLPRSPLLFSQQRAVFARDFPERLPLPVTLQPRPGSTGHSADATSQLCNYMHPVSPLCAVPGAELGAGAAGESGPPRLRPGGGPTRACPSTPRYTILDHSGCCACREWIRAG